MSSVKDELANAVIERWVKRVLPDKPALTFEPVDVFHHLQDEVSEKKRLAKRSKPSYEWHPDPQGKWWRTWFQESNLIIQIDLHFSDGRLQHNHYEIDLEQCSTAASFLHWLYHATTHKSWSSPEMLWALMEVAEEVSERIFEKTIDDAYLDQGTLDWANPKS
jgi:hypothetical protein